MFKNRTVVGIICICLSLGVMFGLLPVINMLSSEKVSVVRVIGDIGIGHQISETDLTSVEVGGLNVPEDAIKDQNEVIGKYTTCEIKTGDYIFPSKISDTAASLQSTLYSLEDGTVAITIPANGNNLSRYLENGDIITLLFKGGSGAKTEDETYFVNDFRYVRVATTISGDGIPREALSPDEKGIYPSPSDIVLVLTDAQAKKMKDLQASGASIDYYLVCKYNDSRASEYVKNQEKYLSESDKQSIAIQATK